MSLKVYDLQCNQGHTFEAWFRSGQDYEQQRERGLLSCPVCDSGKITKKLSAPRINLGKAVVEVEISQKGPSGQSPAVMSPSASQMEQFQAELLGQLRNMVTSSENVGSRFAEEARKMHEGQAPERAIRGTATRQECRELAEDGIAVMPIPEFLDDKKLQ